MSLIGTLGEMKLADVLRLFASTRKTGLLTVTGDRQEASLRFEKGALVHAASGRFQGEEAVLDLFGWRNGQLTFVPDDRHVAPNLTRALEALVLEGLRVGERLHRMHELLPNDRVVFQLGPGPAADADPFPLTAAAWHVLRVLDGARELREVVEASKVPREQVHELLLDMAGQGLVERVDVPQKSLRAVASAGGRKDAAEIDDRYEAEWMRLPRFARGVHKIEVRSAAGKTAVLAVTFRAGIFRDVLLPRAVVAEIGAHEGDDVLVRPHA